MSSKNGKIVTDFSIGSLVSVTTDLKSTVLGFWPNRKNNYFPGPLPVSIERINFYKLENYPYVVCVKSDGTRYMLMFYNDRVFLIDRSFNFYEISTEYDFEYLYGSIKTNTCGALFDGELIFEKSKPRYIIHDCICINSKDVTHNTFTERLEQIKDHEHILQNLTNFSISVKKFYNFDEVDQLVSDVSNIDHKIDGLIFTPVMLPIGNQTQYTLFKWKDVNHHTFDFKIVETSNQTSETKTNSGIGIVGKTAGFSNNTNSAVGFFKAFVNQGQTDELFAAVAKNTPEGRTFGRLLRDISFKNNDIVECSFNQKTQSFDPISIRYDKSHPNSLFTVEKTLINIKENITFDEIIEKIRSIATKVNEKI